MFDSFEHRGKGFKEEVFHAKAHREQNRVTSVRFCCLWWKPLRMARKLAPDKWLFAATVGLALFGVVMVYSASAILAQRENGNQFHYVLKQGVFVFIGFIVMLRRDAVQLSATEEPSHSLRFVVDLHDRFGFGIWFQCDQRRASLDQAAGVLFAAVENLQASSDYFSRVLPREARPVKKATSGARFIPCGVVTGWLAAIVVIEPDFGTAMMLVLIFTVVIYTAGARVLHLAMAAAPALIVAAGLLIFVPWRLKRLITFLDPWADQQGSGFQVVQSLIAIGSGGTNGLGFAQGKQKMLFLPFAHSDFIFAVVGEELGLVGALAIVAVFALFLWRGVRTALLAPDRFGMLLSLGSSRASWRRRSLILVWCFHSCRQREFRCLSFRTVVRLLCRPSRPLAFCSTCRNTRADRLPIFDCRLPIWASVRRRV
jgi:cell division protein FtsW